MNFIQAVTFCLKNFRNFKGRASRPEFWYFHVFITFALTLWYLFLFVFFRAVDMSGYERYDLFIIGGWFLLFTLIAATPMYAVGARRFHDMNFSGWWQLMVLIPSGIGYIAYFIWCAQKGTAGPNRFGADPLEYRPNTNTQ